MYFVLSHESLVEPLLGRLDDRVGSGNTEDGWTNYSQWAICLPDSDNLLWYRLVVLETPLLLR